MFGVVDVAECRTIAVVRKRQTPPRSDTVHDGGSAAALVAGAYAEGRHARGTAPALE